MVPQPFVQHQSQAETPALGGVLATRPLRRAPSSNATPGARQQPQPTTAPAVAARSEAREASIQRLRYGRRADSALAAALAESEQDAARQRAEEEALIDEAIAASLHAGNGRGASCGHGNGNAGGGNSSDSRVEQVTGAGRRREGKQPMPSRAKDNTKMATVGEEAIAVQQHDDDDDELRKAIAESLAHEERRRADVRYEEDSMLHGVVASLRDAVNVEERRAVHDGAGPLAGRPRGGAAAQAGRQMARQILEGHLAEGGGF